MIVARHLGQPRQNAITGTQRRVRGARHHQNARFRPLALPFQRARHQIAIRRGVGHLQHRHRRQLFRVAIGLAPLLQVAFGLQLFQHAFQINPCRTLDAERPRDVAFVGLGGVVGNPGEDLVFGGKGAHAASVSRPWGKVIRCINVAQLIG